MSMQHVVQVLTRGLRQATEDHNWSAVMNVDAKIAELLTAIRGKTLTADERQALDELKKVHQQAREYCQGESDKVEAKLNLAMRNREGAAAYALFSNDGGVR